MSEGCACCLAQMSMKLKLGQMWDHNGTYMEGIGFHYRTHKVVIELSANTVTGESAPDDICILPQQIFLARLNSGIFM